MVPVIKNAKTRENVNQIVEVLSTMGKAKASDISELTGISQWNVSDLIRKYVKPMYPENITVFVGKGYVWKNGEEIKNVQETKTEVIEDKHGYGKNHEGYSDPTASKALDNVEKIMSFRNAPPKPGDICEYECAYYSRSTDVDTYMLVLSVGENYACGYGLKLLEDFYDGEFCFKLRLNKVDYYIDARKVFVKSGKAIKARRFFISEDKFNAIKAKTSKLLGFDVVERVVEKEVKVEVPVEKIVEKVVEVPVEKIVETPVVIDRDDPMVPKLKMELELAQQRAEIWERAYYALATGKGKENDEKKSEFTS